MLRVARYAWQMLPQVDGWEADDIARSIASGHGFSFPGNWRWLWDMSAGNPNEFFPTAWADPVYTHLLAGLHVLLGEHAYAGAFAVSFVCIAIIFYCVYRLGSRIRGAWSGALAVILLALHGETFVSFFGDINSTGFATCILTAYVLVAVRYFEVPSRGRLARARPRDWRNGVGVAGSSLLRVRARCGGRGLSPRTIAHGGAQGRHRARARGDRGAAVDRPQLRDLRRVRSGPNGLRRAHVFRDHRRRVDVHAGCRAHDGARSVDLERARWTPCAPSSPIARSAI